MNGLMRALGGVAGMLVAGVALVCLGLLIGAAAALVVAIF